MAPPEPTPPRKPRIQFPKPMPTAICRRRLALHGCHACSPDFDPTITRFVHCERGEYRSRLKTRIPRARQEPPEQKPGEADKAAGANGEGAWPNWRPESSPPRPPRSPLQAMASIPSTLQYGPPEHADPLRTPRARVGGPWRYSRPGPAVPAPGTTPGVPRQKRNGLPQGAGHTLRATPGTGSNSDRDTGSGSWYVSFAN